MKITLTGSLGNISRPLAKQLIAAGHQVNIISSNADKKTTIEALGATPAIGSITDTDFLTSSFTGADVVYTMVPPDFTVPDLLQYFTIVGNSYAAAIRRSGVQRVVHLSSMGAHLDPSPGPIAGAREAEAILNGLEDVSIKYLRAPFFYINFYNNIDMIRHMGILGSNYPAQTKLVLVHPEDLAAAAAEEIQNGFSGKSIRYVVSDERSSGEVAAILGNAVGKPQLPWVEFNDEQALQGIMQGGMPESIARLFVEVGVALRSGKVWEDYTAAGGRPSGGRKLETFAAEFAERFNQ
jgi:uncharacterized protein YbjT (DUF2867 family)